MLILRNFIKILKSKISLFGVIFGIVLIAILTYYFMDSEMIIGNRGYNYYLFELSLDILISLLFGIFIGSTLYKMTYFSVKKTGVGFLGGFLGVLLSGCPSCTITLASYLGLAGFVSVFPYGGIELKIISVLLLVYVCYTTLNKLEVCELKIKK